MFRHSCQRTIQRGREKLQASIILLLPAGLFWPFLCFLCFLLVRIPLKSYSLLLCISKCQKQHGLNTCDWSWSSSNRKAIQRYVLGAHLQAYPELTAVWNVTVDLWKALTLKPQVRRPSQVVGSTLDNKSSYLHRIAEEEPSRRQTRSPLKSHSH